MKFLKTYGKQKTKLSAWVSLQDRKQVFDSTSGSEADMSTQQAPKPTWIRRRNNLAKKRVPTQLTSENEENVFPHPLPPSRKKSARRKPGTGRVDRATKRKPLLYLSGSSDEEIVVPPTQYPQAANQRKTRGKKSRVHSEETTSEKARLFAAHNHSGEIICPPLPHLKKTNSGSKSGSSETREGDSITRGNWSNVQEYTTLQKDSHVHVPSAGRFVTRRRCAIPASSRALKTNFILNSSDEFASSRGSSKIIRPSRRRFPPVFLESSADNSVNDAGLPSFATNLLRDISLNESREHSLGPCSRKPIFCSTPSAASFSKKSRLINQISSPPSISVSCIGPVSTVQDDLGSPEQLNSPHSASSIPSDEKPPIVGELQKCTHLHHKELSDNVFSQLNSAYDKTSSSGAAKSQYVETQDSQELPSVLTISSDTSSYFKSATGELEWLIDALKEKCLTQLCTVRLERLEDLIHLLSETTYSSCLGDLDVFCKHSLSVATNHSADDTETSVQSTSLKFAVTSEVLQSAQCSKSLVHNVVLLTDSPSTKLSMSDDCKQPDHKSTLDLFSESANSYNDLVDIKVQDKTEELSSILKNKCLSRECSVELKKHLIFEQHLSPEPNLSKNDHTKLRPSQKNNISVFESQPDDPKSEDETVVLTKKFKEKCLNGKSIVKMKKMAVTEINYKLEKNIVVSHKKESELVGEQTVNEPQSECTVASPKETTLGRGRRRKRTSASSNDRIASDKDVSKSSSNRHNSNRKKSLAPKEKKRRTSTNRPGTTRKACVSGFSVSRWKNKDVFTSRLAPGGGPKAVDCSISELIPSQHRQPVEQIGFSMNFSTPVKDSNLNLSSLLTELTPNTHTWSRLKAALSIHRKVILTPKTPGHVSTARMAMADVSQDLFATPFRTPLPKRLRSQLMTHESQLLFEDDDLSDAEKVYAECGQQGPLSWEECFLPQRMKQCVKIGEGTFGEVFSTTCGKTNRETVALKVIPVEGNEKVNGEEQKTFGEILHEIIISKELSCLKDKEKSQTSGFIGLRDLHCVKGCYPSAFLNAWDKFDKQKGSENDRPDFFEKEQLFIILEFEFGGTDLENSNGMLPSIIVAKSILHQVTAALAVAEQELHFEHRDLHWGNVLVKITKQKTVEFSLNETVHSLETKGVLVRIIDYSLSRLEIDELTVSCDISNDEELFMGQGDYQFDIYRLMRQENGNDWSSYNPHSNVLWLHYLCSKLLDMKYRGSGGKRSKDMRDELTSFYDNVLQYSSAKEVLKNSPLFQ